MDSFCYFWRLEISSMTLFWKMTWFLIIYWVSEVSETRLLFFNCKKYKAGDLVAFELLVLFKVVAGNAEFLLKMRDLSDFIHDESRLINNLLPVPQCGYCIPRCPESWKQCSCWRRQFASVSPRAPTLYRSATTSSKCHRSSELRTSSKKAARTPTKPSWFWFPVRTETRYLQ